MTENGRLDAIGTIDALCRYPVKSMGGEEVDEVFVGFGGMLGDRAYAFLPEHGARPGFPWHTARQHEWMLLYRPRYRDDRASRVPVDVATSFAIPPGANPVLPGRDAFALDVTLPDGRTLPVDSDDLRSELEGHAGKPLALRYSERALSDCRPLSLFGNATAAELAGAMGIPVDRRRFRANFYATWTDHLPFKEDRLVGRTVQIGDRLRMVVLERDPRCKMITLDPTTGEMDPSILRYVARAHEGKAGVYAAVLVEGMVRKGDIIGVV